VDESAYTTPPDSGGCFRYDSTAHQFVYNLSSKALPGAATGDVWALRTTVTFNGGQLARHGVDIGLR
jgi:hypothetical protein